MIKTISIQDLSKQISGYKSALIVLGPDPIVDEIAAGLALSGVLQSQGVTAQILCSTPINLDLPLTKSIRNQAQGRQLIVSWPYLQDSVDQITTEIDHEQKRFNLIIHSRPGFTAVDHNNFNYTYAKPEADVMFLIETSSQSIDAFKELATLQTPQILVSMNGNEQFTGQQVTSELPLSYVVYQLAQLLQSQLNNTLATLMLRGIEHRTQGFRDPSLPADLFTAIGQLLKAGGKRQSAPLESPLTQKSQAIPATTTPEQSSQSLPQNTPAPFQATQNPSPSQNQPQSQASRPQNQEPSRSPSAPQNTPNSNQPPRKNLNTDQMVRERSNIPTNSAGLPEWMRPQGKRN